MRPRRSQLKPPARARSARARLQAGAAARMLSQPSPGSSQKAPNKNARETHETFQLQTPGERAQRASKGCTRPTTLAILMFAILSPRWFRGAFWCFALVLLAVVCASLLVLSVACVCFSPRVSVACEAFGSRFSRASRSSIARFLILGVFLEPLVFSKNATPSTRKPCFLRSGGSQNEAKMAPKIDQNPFQNRFPKPSMFRSIFASIFIPFWLQLGAILGLKLEPSWLLTSPKSRPRCLPRRTWEPEPAQTPKLARK